MRRQSQSSGWGRLALPLTIATLLAIAVPARAQTARWQVGTAPSFSSGRYGTETRTDVVFTPMTARRSFEDGDLTVVFPFLCIKGDGAVTVVNGAPVRRDQSGTQTRATAGTTRGTTDVTRTATASAQPQTSCGIGDIVVRGRYYIVDQRRWLPTIAVRAHIKTPTASAERGLGTGRPDEGVGLEVSRRLRGGVLAMVDGGYTFVGAPARSDFNNSWWYDVGVGKDLAKGAINLSVFFEEYSAIVPGLVSAKDILAALTLGGTGGWRIQAAGQFGLSDGAPDHGITFGASRRF
jgi:hypothetical protein